MISKAAKAMIADATDRAFSDCPYPVSVPSRSIALGAAFLPVQRRANDGENYMDELAAWIGKAIRAADGSTIDEYDGTIFREVNEHIARAEAVHIDIPYGYAERAGIIAEEIMEAQEQSARISAGGTYWMPSGYAADAHKRERAEILDAVAVAARVLDAMISERVGGLLASELPVSVPGVLGEIPAPNFGGGL